MKNLHSIFIILEYLFRIDIHHIFLKMISEFEFGFFSGVFSIIRSIQKF